MRGNKGHMFFGLHSVHVENLSGLHQTALWHSRSRIEHFAPHKYFLWAIEGVHIVTDFIRTKTNENKVFIDWISQ